MHHECSCLECRIRSAIRGDKPNQEHSETFAADSAEVLNTLANIAGELLATRELADTEVFLDMIRQRRDRWSDQYHILAQARPAGHA
jgi:hypothetical protein